MKKVVVIGGGTGTFVVLSGLKKYNLDLSVIVTMMDSGGSTGRLRDQLGVLPPGDLRQTLVALSEASLLWRQLFLYRFEQGDLAGHNFGNIFLSALEKVCSNYDEVIDTASYVLKTKGKVIPVTFAKTTLCVAYENGKNVKGEDEIEKNHHETAPIKTAYLDPPVKANKKAMEQIEQADYIITGPGDLYTSIIPVLLVDGIRSQIRKSRAKIIYIMNLMTKGGQTHNYRSFDHIKDLAMYLGRPPEYVVINNRKIPEAMIQWYSQWNEHVVQNDLKTSGFKGNVITGDLIDTAVHRKHQADTLVRSILRHDPEKLAELLIRLL